MTTAHFSPGVVFWLIAILAFGVHERANAGTETSVSNQRETLLRAASDTTIGTSCGPFSRTDSNCLFSAYGWQFLPNSLIYPAYLAGVYESRMGGVWNNDKDLGWVWDATLGGYFPLLRKGTSSGPTPQGFQLDFEGSAHLRLDMENSFELHSTDYRAGVPLSYGLGRWQFKTGFYHVSSHLGDERFARLWEQRYKNKTPPSTVGLGNFRRYYSRDALLLGIAFRPVPSVRLYTEFDFDVGGEADEALDVQMGAEYSEPFQANKAISPFAAAHLRFFGEKNNDTSFCLQIGLQSRSTRNQLFRVGVQYYTGFPEQYQRFRYKEHKFGIGLWYDY